MAGLNCGVKLLLDKRYHEAVATFTSLLGRLRAQRSCMEDEEGQASFDQKDEHQWVHFLHPIQRQDLNDSECFIFASPLIIVDCPTASTKPPSNLTLSLMTVYNLALTYHLGATETKPCDSIFRKALSFYQLAHNIQQVPNDLGNDISTLLSIGISNNIGHIHGYVGHQDKATQCFQHLLNTIMYVTGCGWTSQKVPQIDGFLHNVQSWVLKQQPAPAA
ncbi:expressed unknown protein [Seminavis robusta]|uniref:Uncharacterized protein n=1 Tax=Seminavis robusta TaxID=568900 RepID=A0A9N8D8C2_9STRA|nr:expressed unknown protein [Seminavis robusta]|eukprot:Sro13_g010310.1 n/a (219) ;mRNA; r:174415-175071